jgi:ankyrin repeat protein
MLDALPGNSKSIIHEALDLIMSQPDNLRNVAYSCLVWLANIDRPVSVEGFRQGLSVLSSVRIFSQTPLQEKDDLKLLQGFSSAFEKSSHPFKIDSETIPPSKALLGPYGCCRGLVVQEPGSLNVLLAHEEIKIHLKDYREEDEYFKEKFYNQERKNLVWSCLYYLLLSDFDSGPCRTRDIYMKRLASHPFLEYAAVCWSSHARQVAHVDVDRLVITLLGSGTNLSAALQVLLLDDVPTGSEAEFTNVYETCKSMTALQVATKLNLTDIVKFLLKKGADPLTPDCTGDTALHEATKNENVEIFTLLFNQVVEKAFKLFVQNDTNFNLDLFIGELKKKETLFEFYKKRVRPKRQLCKFVTNKDLHGVLAELCVGVSPNSRENEVPALQLAVDSGSTDITSALIRFGADVEESDYAALLSAVRSNNVDIVQELLRHSSNGPPDPALFESIEAGNIDITRLLLEKGANLRTTTPDTKRGVLHVAAASNKAEMVDFLLLQGANASQLDNEDQTPLFDAIKSQDVITIKHLLQSGVDICAATKRHRRALHEAAKVGNEDILMLIMNRSLDVDCMDLDGNTPMDIAITEGHTRICHLLQARRKSKVRPNLHASKSKSVENVSPKLDMRGTNSW